MRRAPRLIALVVAVAACAKVDNPHVSPDGSPSPPAVRVDSAVEGGDAMVGHTVDLADGPVGRPLDLADAPVGPTADGLNCGITTFALERMPPDVLIVLDKSQSMADSAQDPRICRVQVCDSKWRDMKEALIATVGGTQAAINWGLKLFPNDDRCGVTDDVSAPVAPGNAAVVIAAIQRAFPSGLTPTRLALEASHRYLMMLPKSSSRYIVLATDGLPACGGVDESPGAIMAVAKVAAAGIPVFVIGIATQPDAAATLSAMARAGGKPRAANPAYYPVSTSADLSAALASIGGLVVSCTLPIKQPPDPANIAVDADGKRVPRSDTDGWTYGPAMTTIELRGSWCTKYQSGAVKDVKAIFGCPGIIVI